MSRLIFTTNQVHQESIYRLTALQSLSLHYIFPCLGLHSTLKTLKNCCSFLQKQRQGHHINFSLEETACKKGTALARFYTEPLKKLSPSIWKDLKEPQLHKQSARIFRGFWNINKRACRYIILQQQLWQQRENVLESYYKSHNTATALHIQAWLVPQATWQQNPIFTDGSQRGCVCGWTSCVCVCVILFYSWKYSNQNLYLSL